MKKSLFIAIFILQGCMVGPNFTPPPQKELSKKDTKYLKSWWRIYHDKNLNRLISLAYRQNLDLKSAGVRILESRALLGVSRGYAFPQLQKVSTNGLIQNAKSQPQSSFTTTAGFDLGWEIDFWGKYARGVESSKAKLFASIASYRDVLVSIIAEVVKNYITYESLRERIIYAKRAIKIQEYVVKITKIQFNSGNVSELDMQQAKSQLYSLKSTLYELKLAKVKAQHSLALLLGVTPNKILKYLNKNTPPDKITTYLKNDKNIIQLDDRYSWRLSLVPIPKLNPNKRFDAKLLSQRPDVKVAEYIAQSKAADIGVAEAKLYPSFSLIGSIGYTNNSLLPYDITVLAGPSFGWNIFQYGRIREYIRLKDAVFEESLIEYNKTLLRAINEVSFALNSYRLHKKELIQNQKALKAAIRAFNISIKQYSDGLVSYQRLLNSIEKLTKYQDQYASIKASVAVDVALLFKALGGGWQISTNKAYLSNDNISNLKSRGYWEKKLKKEQILLPKGWMK